VWLSREPAVLKTATLFQLPTEIKTKVVKLLPITSVIKLLKAVNIQDSKECKFFLEWCLQSQNELLTADKKIVDLTNVCACLFYFFIFIFGLF
jgi:hypothetical protein